MLDIMNKLTQLSEATKDTGKGKIHTADPGGYGRKDDEEDEDGKKKVAPASTEKKGRGRPKKATQSSGEDKKYDTDTLGSVFGGGKKPSKAVDKLPKKKNSLKEYFDQLDAALNEGVLDATRDRIQSGQGGALNQVRNNMQQRGAGMPAVNKMHQGVQQRLSAMAGRPVAETDQIEIKPASQMPKTPGQTAGATSQPGQPQQVAGQPQKQTQVIAQGDKTLGTVNNPQLANQIKQSIGKGEMTLMPDEMDEGILDTVKKVGGKVLDTLGHGSDEELLRDLQKKAGIPSHAQHGKPAMAHPKDEEQLDEKDIGKHNNANTGFDALVRKLTPKYGVEAAKRIAGAQLKKIKEADVPPSDDDMGAGLGAGRSQGMLESKAKSDLMNKDGKKKCPPMSHVKKMCQDGKSVAEICKMHPDCDHKELKQMVADCKKTLDEGAKPDFLDMDKDGNKKETMKKAVADKKKMKVKEGMDSRLKAAHHAGKSHALGKQGYNCTFEGMEEARCYHEGYKQGLDECYDQMPIQGYVGEANPSVVDDMASYGAHTPEVDEGNAFTAALANTPKGGKFSVGGKTFTDHSSLEESPFAFEALEQQLNALLEGKEDVAEGMTVSISKGQQGQPDSVSINAQDGEAEQLLALVKQAGLGLFGGDEPAHTGSQMSINADGPMAQEPGAEIEVVDDHDDMLSLIRKMTGQGAAPVASSDYEDEEASHEEGHSHDDSCNECGMAYESCGCDDSEEVVDEDETLDQREEEVAEAEEVVNNDDEAEEEQTDSTRDAALAQAADQNFADTDAPIKEDDTDEDDLEESYANGDDDTFETDIDFMTNVISGGLNKKKATGQSTIPVVASQASRLGNPMQESVDLLTDWRSLAGIK